MRSGVARTAKRRCFHAKPSEVDQSCDMFDLARILESKT